jgi:hypothetical protein
MNTQGWRAVTLNVGIFSAGISEKETVKQLRKLKNHFKYARK